MEGGCDGKAVHCGGGGGTSAQLLHARRLTTSSNKNGTTERGEPQQERNNGNSPPEHAAFVLQACCFASATHPLVAAVQNLRAHLKQRSSLCCRSSKSKLSSVKCEATKEAPWSNAACCPAGPSSFAW